MADNLNTASKKAINEAKLAQLDDLGSDPSAFLIEESLNAVEGVMGDFIVRVQENIASADLIVTGKIDEIEVERVSDTEVVIKVNDYLLYQDLGVNGSEVKSYNTPFTYRDKMPPVSVIQDWVIARGIGDPNESKQTAFAIAKKIQKEGIKPKNIMTKEIPQLEEDLANIIGDLAASVVVAVIPKEIIIGDK
jgi:hypothetical protein